MNLHLSQHTFDFLKYLSFSSNFVVIEIYLVHVISIIDLVIELSKTFIQVSLIFFNEESVYGENVFLHFLIEQVLLL